MAEPRLIENYLAALNRRLPKDIVEELADGLGSTYQRHVAAGFEARAAQQAALAEFGDADTVAVSFAVTAPARRAARALLVVGPLVGGCWAVVLLSAHAWDWPTPAALRVGCGAVLAIVIALLVTAARVNGYRTARRAATAACLGLLVLDLALPAAVVLPGLVRGWPTVLATSVSLLRLGFTTGALRRMHAR